MASNEELIKAINSLTEQLQQVNQAGQRAQATQGAGGLSAGSSPSGADRSTNFFYQSVAQQAGLGGLGGAFGAAGLPGVALTAATVGFGAARELTAAGLNVANDISNPFKTSELNALDAAESVVGSIPGFGGLGQKALSLGFNLTGVTQGRTAQERALSTTLGFVRGQIESGVEPTTGQVQEFAKQRLKIEEAFETKFRPLVNQAIGQAARDSTDPNTKALIKVADAIDRLISKLDSASGTVSRLPIPVPSPTGGIGFIFPGGTLGNR